MFQTVDPKYESWPKLVGFLVKLNIITLGQRRHRYSIGMSLLGAQQPVIPGHWIPLAIISLSREYIELVPLERNRC